MMKISDHIYYVGVSDRTQKLFENMWPLPYGISYNTYLIDDEKTVLIDCVDVCYFEKFLQRVRSILGDRPLDYLVINHMEPDHSGAIGLLKQVYPDITIVGNKKTFGLLDGFYGGHAHRVVVGEGDTLPIGSRTLSFHLIPMVHWPETMVTYSTTEGILFTGDAFGCYGALNGAIIDRDMNTDIYWAEMERYYSNIVGKYGVQVQSALAKLGKLDVQMLCPTHGPVWADQRERAMAVYDRLSRYEATEGVLVAYGSLYGHTQQMAEVVAEQLALRGIRDIALRDVSHTHHSFLLADAFRYKGLIVCAPTYNMHLYPQMEAFLNHVEGKGVKNRYIACFGAFSWAGAAMKKMVEMNEKLKFEMVGEAFEMKQGGTPDDETKARRLADAMADRLIADRPA